LSVSDAGLALADARPNARPRCGPLWTVVLLRHRVLSQPCYDLFDEAISAK